MNTDKIYEKLISLRLLDTGPLMSYRGEIGDLIAALDAISQNGVTAVIKIDGERTQESRYTVVVSGPPLGEEFFRKDGSDLPSLIFGALEFFFRVSMTNTGSD